MFVDDDVRQLDTLGIGVPSKHDYVIPWLQFFFSFLLSPSHALSCALLLTIYLLRTCSP